MGRRASRARPPKRSQRGHCITTDKPHGRVVARRGPVLTVECGDRERVTCLARGRGKAAVVGDDVHFDPVAGEGATPGLVIAIRPRRTLLQRTVPDRRRPQSLAANVNRLFIVCAVKPALKEGLVDRYLVAAAAAGIEAQIVLNKIDLLNGRTPPAQAAQSFDARLEVYRDLAYVVHAVSAHDRRGIAQLEAAIAGHTAMFVGHSGVGKTSLLNTLIPGLDERVGEVSTATGRGQHITTTTTLFALPNGGEIIDSPGVRSFSLYGITAEALRELFVEFEQPALSCRFANCTHTCEPRCAVITAVEQGEISSGRYDSYRRIRNSLEENGGAGSNHSKSGSMT